MVVYCLWLIVYVDVLVAYIDRTPLHFLAIKVAALSDLRRCDVRPICRTARVRDRSISIENLAHEQVDMCAHARA